MDGAEGPGSCPAHARHGADVPERIVGYDNDRGKGDSRHYRDREEPYAFTTVESLIDDFRRDIESEQGSRSDHPLSADRSTAPCGGVLGWCRTQDSLRPTGSAMSALPHPIRRRPLSVHDYHRMGDAGIFAPGERVELIEGEIIEMAPIGNPHMSVVDRLTHRLVRVVDDRAIVRVQGAVRLSELSEPQPDLAVLSPRDDYYASRSATPADVLLLIEVADSSLAWDRGTKARLYARSGIVEYWLMDVTARVVTRHLEPGTDGYGEMAAIDIGTPIALQAAPDIIVDLSVLFGTD